MTEDGQLDLAFDASADARPDGLSAWHTERRRQTLELCARLAVPLGEMVEVHLSQGPVLRGKLMLAEEWLLSPTDKRRVLFQIERTTFLQAEAESVVRLGEEAKGET